MADITAEPDVKIVIISQGEFMLNDVAADVHAEDLLNFFTCDMPEAAIRLCFEH